MLPLYWRLGLLFSLAITWQVVGCTLQLQPITKLAGWQADGSWVLNAARTVAAGTAVAKAGVHVLQRSQGIWLLADVVAPPELEVANFVAGSALMSNDGRLLAVAAESKYPSSAVTSSQQVVVGYLYKVVAQPHSQHAFRYQLAEQLAVPLDGNGTDNYGKSSTGKVLSTRAHLSMAPDGKTIVACWTTGRQQGAAIGTSHAAAAAAEYPYSMSGGAAVFSWRGYGQTLQVTQLTAPKGSASFGNTCAVSEDGRVALVVDGARGALVYRLEAQTPPLGSAASYKAAGWLAGGLARQQYQVLAAALSQSGSQAVLMVQALQHSSQGPLKTPRITLRVFAADAFGHWADVCSLELSDGHQLGDTRNLQGEVSVAAFPGGVHVSARLAGLQLVYAVGLDGSTPTHCPTQPVLRTVTIEEQAAGRGAPGPATRAGKARPEDGVQGVRSGKLRVEGGAIVYVPAE